jgi:hypothetical protein
MIISITVPDAYIREAQDRGQNVIEYVEQLIDQGHQVLYKPPVLDDAISRIRALRGSALSSRG